MSVFILMEEQFQLNVSLLDLITFPRHGGSAKLNYQVIFFV